MKKLILKTTLLFISLTTFGQTTATYDIVFTSNWEAHGTLPGGAHFTELVGASHNNSVTFLEMGSLATSGIEQVAETGLFSIFNSEVTTAINANNADQFIIGPDLFFNGPGRTITINDLTISSEYPLISLASMLAPSPDWMIAVNSISLIDNSGQWIPEITMDLFTYDAGTEEGTGYSLNNAATSPHEPISLVETSNSPLNSQKIGTIVFTQKQLSVEEFGTQKDKITISPNPSNGNISIATTQASTVKEIEVYNVLGKQVRKYNFKESNSNINLDLTNLNSGIYLVRLYTNVGKTETQKIILR
ncbi:Por secretion system C-terminal sorting domain-containing protein [Aquimarina amphilecti]|uniref:Por secretion system C-terminal sorting domain-containing protein n=1 Tax=Aquimarina amphilecti TaxID=1038014 RepID=A0A1H7PM61_AQUAM|nr:spondin domain-containing protein [Aquimarina amphilecti]SEL36666.1 Por secretion system C-terminal sorting domain-containing protein [Aquimarina amphilecti]